VLRLCHQQSLLRGTTIIVLDTDVMPLKPSCFNASPDDSKIAQEFNILLLGTGWLVLRNRRCRFFLCRQIGAYRILGWLWDILLVEHGGSVRVRDTRRDDDLGLGQMMRTRYTIQGAWAILGKLGCSRHKNFRGACRENTFKLDSRCPLWPCERIVSTPPRLQRW